MLTKIKNIIQKPFWHQFKDVRFLGFVVFGVMVLLASWSGVKVIETNYELQKQIAQLDQQNQIQELINANLKLQNEFYKTDTYLELSARKQFGKGAPGEKLMLVPKSVALLHAKELPADKSKNSESQSDDKQESQSNFSAWMDFLFRHDS